MVVHTGKGRDTGGTCRQREGRGSWRRRERGGQRCGGMPDKKRTWSACPRRGRCQPPLEIGLPQHSGHGGRSSERRRRRLEETQNSLLGSGIGGVISCLSSSGRSQRNARSCHPKSTPHGASSSFPLFEAESSARFSSFALAPSI